MDILDLKYRRYNAILIGNIGVGDTFYRTMLRGYATAVFPSVRLWRSGMFSHRLECCFI